MDDFKYVWCYNIFWKPRDIDGINQTYKLCHPFSTKEEANDELTKVKKSPATYIDNIKPNILLFNKKHIKLNINVDDLYVDTDPWVYSIYWKPKGFIGVRGTYNLCYPIATKKHALEKLIRIKKNPVAYIEATWPHILGVIWTQFLSNNANNGDVDDLHIDKNTVIDINDFYIDKATTIVI
jgi:hypothetical protein